MKNLIAAVLIASICTQTTAQEIQNTEHNNTKPRKHEIGLTGEFVNFGDDFNSSFIQALQFKKWKNEHFGARFLVGHSTYQNDQSFPVTYLSNNDTITQNTPLTFGNLAFAGVGLEAQRQFYKKVYLFASVEGRFGFGNARVDTFQERVTASGTPIQSDIKTIQTGNSNDLEVFQAALTPTFGAKFQFPRITFGSEMAWNIMNYTNLKSTVGSTSSVDMDMSKMGARFFIHYRF